MREIKLRSWDKINNKFIELFFINFENGIPIILGGKDGFEYDIDNIIIMQFTGLKDKNGKDIFEGDILKDKWENLFKVYFAGGIGAFRMENINDCDDFAGFDFHVNENYFDSSDLEVIGNIYENPELLEEKK